MVLTAGIWRGACAGAPVPSAAAGAGSELDAGADSGAWEATGADSGAARASPEVGALAGTSPMPCSKSLLEALAQVQNKLRRTRAIADGLRMSAAAALQTVYQSFQDTARIRSAPTIAVDCCIK